MENIENLNTLEPVELHILKILYSERKGISKAQMIDKVRETATENWSKDSIISAASKLEVYSLIDINKRPNFHTKEKSL